MYFPVALIITGVSEKYITSIIWVTRIGEGIVTANIPSSRILFTLMMGMMHSFETSVLTRATWHNIPEEVFFFVMEFKRDIF
jgi:hypothetical protein